MREPVHLGKALNYPSCKTWVFVGQCLAQLVFFVCKVFLLAYLNYPNFWLYWKPEDKVKLLLFRHLSISILLLIKNVIVLEGTLCSNVPHLKPCRQIVFAYSSFLFVNALILLAIPISYYKIWRIGGKSIIFQKGHFGDFLAK